MQFSVKDVVDRRAIIDSEKTASQRKDNVIFRGQIIEVPVVRLQIDLPIYRMRNGRTQVEHSLLIKSQGKSNDYFINGEENDSAQRLQHKILLELSKDEKGPIYRELESVAVQRENLLITSSGVVVNGNRRLSAMRDLFINDSETYSEFSHVNAAVLPPEANENDIEMIEAELQLVPETKLNYGWIERLLKLKYHRETMRWPIDVIKKIYRFRREEDINIEIQQLFLAEEYLEKYLGDPDNYSEVRNSEQLFKDLQKAISGKGGEEANLRRLLGFLIAKESRNLGDRAYGYRDIFGKEFEKVLRKFAQDEGIELTEVSFNGQDVNIEDEDDPLSGLETDRPTIFDPIKDILQDTSKSAETAEKLAKILDSVKQETNETKSKQLALENVKEALRLLNVIDISKSEPETHAQIRGQLESIIRVSGVILNNLMEPSEI